MIDLEALLVYPSVFVGAFTRLQLYRAFPVLVVVERDLKDTTPIHLSDKVDDTGRQRRQGQHWELDGSFNIWYILKIPIGVNLGSH